MRTVHKFELDAAVTTLSIPENAKPLLVGDQMGKAMIWFELETDEPKVRRTFWLVGTGQLIAADARHCGSFMSHNGMFLAHVYEISQ